MTEAQRRGMPLLSGPPPDMYSNSDRAVTGCRKCNKEFNVIFTRAKKCNHCGYLYCSTCTDYQALMPRLNDDRGTVGYDALPVCSYCIEYLTMTAAGRAQLKDMSLVKLRKYAEAYGINISGAVEKDDVIESIMKARGPNGCLLPQNEAYYRKYSVPDHSGPRPRGLLSRIADELNPNSPRPTVPNNPRPQPPPRPPRAEFARPDLAPEPTPPFGVPPRPRSTSHESPNTASGVRSSPRPQAFPRQHWPQTGGSPQPPHQANPHYPYPQWRQRATSAHASSNAPRPQAATTAAAPPPAKPAPIPAPPLDELVLYPRSMIQKLTISTLKTILFENHIPSQNVLEKEELVKSVIRLVDEERAKIRRKEEEEAQERQLAQAAEAAAVRVVAEHEHGSTNDSPEPSQTAPSPEAAEQPGHTPTPEQTAHGVSLPPKIQQMTADLERSGLCVICQDEEANIVVVDCGHLAMCRACADLVMTSSRECPLCRTRIITDARLLRVFKS